MDDRTRLLALVDAKRKVKTDKNRLVDLDQDMDHYRPRYLYGTGDESTRAQVKSETSRTGPTDSVPPLLIHPLPLAAPSREVLPADLSPPSSKSLSRIAEVPTPESEQGTYTTRAAPNISTASDTQSLLNNPSKNYPGYNSFTVARQPSEVLEDSNQEPITQNTPIYNNGHEIINSSGSETLYTASGISDFSNRSSFPNQLSSDRHPLNIKKQISNVGSTLPGTANQGQSKSAGDYNKSDSSSLLVKPNMEFNGYLSDGEKKKKTRGVDNNDTKSDDKTPFFVYYLACFATIGGLLFGYDTGIVSGSMILIKDYFELSTMWQEIIVSGTVGAAAVFSLFAGFMCDFFGRKVTIMVASVVFVAGAVIMGASHSTGMLLAGRIVVGIGIGFASMTVPVYVAEAAPPAIRGRLVTLNQLFITIGILISSVIAGAFSGMKTTGWRYMLGLAGVPGIIQFIGFLFLPESPRWLVMKGREEAAAKVLQRIRGKDDVLEELREIREAVEEDKKQEGFVLGRVIRTQHVRKALFVGCGLQVFQQLCGINTVIYYSATILKMSGFPSEAAIWLVLVPNGINFLSTFIGVALVERLGRKKLIVVSFLGVVTALVVLAVGFQLSANFSPSIDHNITELYSNGSIVTDGCFNKQYSNCEKCIEDGDCGFCFTGSGDQGSCLKVKKHDEDTLSIYGRCQNGTLKSDNKMDFSHGYCPTDFTWMAVLGLALFVMAFAPGLGPMPWTINSEIYPMWARSTCTSIATGANWICNLLVSLFFLTLTETITKYGAFWLFAGICFLGMIFTIIFLPETKNKSLEEVQKLFMSKNKRGADNLAYEREVHPPVSNVNTRL